MGNKRKRVQSKVVEMHIYGRRNGKVQDFWKVLVDD